MIYFIRCEQTGHVKIGFAANPDRRLKQLQTGSASRLCMLRTIAGGKEVEKWLHSKFSHLCVVGEWFRFSDEMLSVSVLGADLKVVSKTRLQRYLSEMGITQQRLGEIVGVSQAAINRYANGERFPSPVMIKKIEKATGNRVKVKDWYEGVTAEAAE